MTKVVGLVQARMGSTRLPGKVLADIAGQPLIHHIVDRLLAVDQVEEVVLTTTADARNDPLAEYAERLGLAVQRGPREDDVAERLAAAADLVGADAVLKVNGDCPLVDPHVLGRLVDVFLHGHGLAYVSNKITWSWPEGLSAEVIATSALRWCDEHLRDETDRELVANWIRDHPDRFPQASVVGDRDLTHLHLAVDTADDLEQVRRIFAALHQPDRLFTFEEVLALLGV